MTGRPPSFKPEYVEQAKKLCLLGATDMEMADFFEVASSTFYKWKHDYPEFSEALKAGKAEADDRVERSLYHRAVGYTFESEKIITYQGTFERVPIREHVPPDTTAMIFWLKNRRGADWRDKTEHVVKREQEWTDEQLDTRIRQITGSLGIEGGAGESVGGKAAAPGSKSLN